MPNTVKLTSADMRAWRLNQSQWVSPEGYVLGPVTREEETALFPAIERAKAVAKSGPASVVAEYKTTDAQGRVHIHKVPLSVMFRVTTTGRERGNFLLEIFVNGNRYVKGREIIEKRMLAKYGECSLHGLNGKRLKVIRDPGIKRPTHAESQRSSPTPERCICRAWKENSDASRHHQACHWNAKAPAHERALPFQYEQLPSILDDRSQVSALAFAPSHGLAVVGGPVPLQRQRVNDVRVQEAIMMPPEDNDLGITRTLVPDVPQEECLSPDECKNDCRGILSGEPGWKWPANKRPEKNQHHPMCQYEPAWRRSQSQADVWMLFDLDRKKEVREATPDEVTEAQISLARDGISSVDVGGHLFAVVRAGAAPVVYNAGGHVAGPIAGLARKAVKEMVREEHAPAPLPVASPVDDERQRAQAVRMASLPPRPGQVGQAPSRGAARVPAVAAPAAMAASFPEPSPEPLSRLVPDARELDRVESAPRLMRSVPVTAQSAKIAALKARLAALEELEAAEAEAEAAQTATEEAAEEAAEEEAVRPFGPPGREEYSGRLPERFGDGVLESAGYDAEADLRDERGLVGNQRLTDQIEPGPVELYEPVPFVDPLGGVEGDHAHGGAGEHASA